MFFVEGNNNARYTVRYLSEGDEYQITATDFVRMWTETMTSEEIIARCKEMNPNIEAPPQSLLTRVLDLLDQYDTNVCGTVALTGGKMQITVQTRMAGFMFRFLFDMTLSDAAQFAKEVTQPLILVMKELHAKVTHLCDHLKRKDLEIQQYKLEGAQILRKSVETQPFNREEFEKQYLTKDCQNVQESTINMMSLDLLKLWEATSLLQAPKSDEVKVEIKQEPYLKIKEEPMSSDDHAGVINGHLTSSKVAEIVEPKIEYPIKIERNSENNHNCNVEKRKKVLKRKLRL